MSVTDSHSHSTPSSDPEDFSPVLVPSRGFRSQHQRLVDQWGPRVELDSCPGSKYHWRNTETHVAGAPIGCRKSTCIFCLRVMATQVRAAVKLARPSRMALLTALSGDWQTDRKMVNRLRFYLRDRDGLTFAFAWAIEPNPKDTGYHAHGWVWGDPIPRETFQYRATSAGLGMANLIRVTNERDFAYPMKNATHNARSLHEHRRLNGREPIHARGFWRDTATGEINLKKAEAIKRSTPVRPADSGTWVAVPNRTFGAAPMSIHELTSERSLSRYGRSGTTTLAPVHTVGDGS